MQQQKGSAMRYYGWFAATLLAMCALAYMFPRVTAVSKSEPEVIIGSAVQATPLPSKWRKRLFEHVALSSVAKTNNVAAYVRARKEVRDPVHGFEFLFIADDGSVYSYTYGLSRAEWLEVRVEYPSVGIYLVAYADYGRGHIISGWGNTSLRFDPSVPLENQKDMKNDWQGKVNDALLALADRSDFDRPLGYEKK